MKTLEEILAPLEELQAVGVSRTYSVACIRAVPDLIAVRDEFRQILKYHRDWLTNEIKAQDYCYVPPSRRLSRNGWESLMEKMSRILGEPPANPKPAAEEPRT